MDIPAAADPGRTAPDPLLARLRAGEAAAYRELVRANAPRLQATARRILRDEHEAQDAVQDAFLAAFRALADFDGASSLGTWLHRIAVNAALQRLRRRPRAPTCSVEDLLPAWSDDGHHATPPRAFAESPESCAARAETRSLVRAAIDRLPDDYRLALVLRDVEEIPVAEAARSLGISEGALKVRAHRARQALRTLLEPHLQRTP